jgi:hypothetical protein
MGIVARLLNPSYDDRLDAILATQNDAEHSARNLLACSE